MSRTARGSGAVIDASGSVRIPIAASFSSPSRRSPRSSSSETCLRRRRCRSSPITCSSRRRWRTVSPTRSSRRSIFSRRHADRARSVRGRMPSVAGVARRPARRRRARRASRRPRRRASASRPGVGLAVARHVPAQRVRAAQQRARRAAAGSSPASRARREHVLDRVREPRRRSSSPSIAGAALDRVGVAEERVDRVRRRVAALEREQGVDHAVEPLVRLVAEELEELGFGVGLDVDHAPLDGRSAKRRSTSTTPTSPAVVEHGAGEQLRLASPRRVGGSAPTSVTSSIAKPARRRLVLGDEQALRPAVAARSRARTRDRRPAGPGRGDSGRRATAPCAAGHGRQLAELGDLEHVLDRRARRTRRPRAAARARRSRDGRSPAPCVAVAGERLLEPR